MFLLVQSQGLKKFSIRKFANFLISLASSTVNEILAILTNKIFLYIPIGTKRALCEYQYLLICIVYLQLADSNIFGFVL